MRDPCRDIRVARHYSRVSNDTIVVIFLLGLVLETLSDAVYGWWKWFVVHLAMGSILVLLVYCRSANVALRIFHCVDVYCALVRHTCWGVRRRCASFTQGYSLLRIGVMMQHFTVAKVCCYAFGHLESRICKYGSLLTFLRLITMAWWLIVVWKVNTGRKVGASCVNQRVFVLRCWGFDFFICRLLGVYRSLLADINRLNLSVLFPLTVCSILDAYCLVLLT